MASSPVSSLSSLESEEMPEMPPNEHDDNASQDPDADFDDNESANGTSRPVKRRRISGHKYSAGVDSPPSISVPAPEDDEYEDLGDISSDTTGSAPSTPKPGYIALVAEDVLASECTRECRWDGCTAGDVGNQDILVDHVHNEHVQNAKKDKFACQWEDCRAKGKPQMSAYALRAHMRSHTKEKPFYCLLPECDKSFTRSDALAKHMRTVHENETLRISDLFAHNKKVQDKDKGGSPDADAGPQQPAHAPETTKRTMLKLTFNGKSASSSAEPTHDGEVVIAPRSPLSPTSLEQLLGPFPEDLDFSAHEREMKPKELFHLLRRQERWAQQEQEGLEAQLREMEEKYKAEWTRTQLIFENVMEAANTQAVVNGVFDNDGEDPLFKQLRDEGLPEDEEDPNAIKINRIRKVMERLSDEADAAAQVPIPNGDLLWYRSDPPQKIQKIRNGIDREPNGIGAGGSDAMEAADTDGEAGESS